MMSRPFIYLIYMFLRLLPATVSVYFDWGGADAAPGTSTDVDTLGPPAVRFKTNDNATIDGVDPIPIPAAGTNNSYWKHIYLYCDIAPSSQIDNVKFFTDGSNFGAGITMNVGNETPVKNSGSSAGYEVATGVVGTSGDDLVTNHAGITGVTNAFTYVTGSPKNITISEAGGIINLAAETSNYLVFQMVVGTTATSGDLTDETWTLRYDEI